MKYIKIICVATSILIFATCSSKKKSVAVTAPPDPAPSSKPSNGVYPPGDAEFFALKMKYNDVTLPTLTLGYELYTGICTMCHQAYGIYQFPEGAWPTILERMAPKARITDVQKDAIYKYVLAIKTTQPK